MAEDSISNLDLNTSLTHKRYLPHVLHTQIKLFPHRNTSSSNFCAGQEISDQIDIRQTDIIIKVDKQGDGDGEEEGDDGFKTPTSVVHKIPEVRPCPPAPKKPSMSSWKRKLSPDICSHRSDRRVFLDYSREVELMYPPHLQENLGRKIKKAKSV